MSAAFRPQFIVAVALIVLGAAPAAIAWLIVAYGVNVPYWDQMTVAEFLVRNHGRPFPELSDLFAQHNESRNVIPRLLFFYLARITGWNVKWEMAFSLGLACLVAGGVWLLARRFFDFTTAAVATAAASLLIFSPVQWWNWTVGFQLAMFVPIVMLVLALLAIARGHLSVSAAAAAIATFSFANGILLWVALLPLVWFKGVERKRLAVTIGAWSAAAVATSALFFYGYEKPAGLPPMTLPHEAPIRFAGYCLAFLGHPLSWTRDVATTMAVGAALVMAFVVCLIAAWRQGRAEALYWGTLGLYAGLSAGAAATGRMRLALAQALEPRYTTLSIYLAVSVMLLIFVTASRRMQAMALALLVAGHALAVRVEWPYLKIFHRERLAGRAAVDFALVAGEHSALRALVYPDVQSALRTIEGLARIGYLDPIRTDLVGPIDAGGPPLFGDFTGLQPLAAGWGAFGWASLPEVRPADAVLITRMTDAGARVVGVSPSAAVPQRGIGEMEPALLYSGWRYVLPADVVRPDDRLEAWAYDTRERLAYRLNGSFMPRKSG